MKRSAYMKRKHRNGPAERESQKEVVDYLRRRENVLFTATPYYVHRHHTGANYLYGYTSGTPDLHVLEARRGYHGMFIEMKKEKGGRVTDTQNLFHEKLRARGYYIVVSHGHEDAIKSLEWYLGPAPVYDSEDEGEPLSSHGEGESEP